MGVVKGGASGSGQLPVARALVEAGVEELAVATVAEGIYLRDHGITLPITVLGKLLYLSLLWKSHYPEAVLKKVLHSYQSILNRSNHYGLH